MYVCVCGGGGGSLCCKGLAHCVPCIISQLPIRSSSFNINYFLLQLALMRVFYIPFLTGKAFIRRTEDYTILVMSNLRRYLKFMVVTIHRVPYLTVRTVFNIRNMFLSNGGVDNNIIHNLTYVLVKLHTQEESLYYHATFGIYFHNPCQRFTQLLICKFLHVFKSHKLYPM